MLCYFVKCVSCAWVIDQESDIMCDSLFDRSVCFKVLRLPGRETMVLWEVGVYCYSETHQGNYHHMIVCVIQNS